ncbi:MAG: MICOS complex subunit MIC60 [Alphaproteobacteria bacterium]
MSTRQDQGEGPGTDSAAGGGPVAPFAAPFAAGSGPPPPAGAADAELEPGRPRTSPGVRLKLVAALLLVVVFAGLAGVASLPWWRDRVPEGYRGVLPTFPEEDRRLGQLGAATEALRRDLAMAVNHIDRVTKVITALEQRVGDLETRASVVVAPSSPPVAAEPAVDPDLVRRLSDLEGRVTAVDPAPLVERARQLESRIDGVSGRIDVIARGQIGPATMVQVFDRIAAVEEMARKASARQDSALALTLAVAQLRDAVARGSAFETELQTVRALSDEPAAVDQAAAGFVSHAARGMPTQAALALRFESLVAEVARASVAPEGGGWAERTVQRLMALATVRRTDGTAVGESAVAVMARAQARMQAGDLAGAVREMKALSGAAAQAAEAWLADARARVAADEGLSALTARALGRSAAARTGG